MTSVRCTMAVLNLHNTMALKHYIGKTPSTCFRAHSSRLRKRALPFVTTVILWVLEATRSSRDSIAALGSLEGSRVGKDLLTKIYNGNVFVPAGSGALCLLDGVENLDNKLHNAAARLL